MAAAFVSALAAFSWRGWYARYLTDDYCTAGLLKTLGFFGAMAHHRREWSGRFSYFPLKALFESIGPVTARITPTVMIVLLFAACLFTARRVLKPESRLAAVTIALAFTFAIVDASPSLTNIGGALYWETGAVTYMTPLILFTCWVTLFPSRLTAGAAAAASGIVMFVAGGMSETSLAAQAAATGGALLLGLALRDRRYSAIAAAGLAATLIAFAVVASAPGNAIRVETEITAREPATALLYSLTLANQFIGTYVFAGGLALLPLMAIAFVFGTTSRTIDPRITLGSAAVAAGAYVVSFVPGAWLLPDGPPERALDVPNYFAIAAIFAVALAAGRRAGELSRRGTLAAASLTLLLVVVPVWSIRANVDALPHARFIAAKTDAADALLRRSHGQHVALKAPWAISQRIFHVHPDHWSSRCVSRYYGLQSFHAVR